MPLQAVHHAHTVLLTLMNPKGGLRASRLHAGLTQQVSELECQLAAAQRDVQRLAADNDALMEVSNALAAQQRRARQKLEAEAQEGTS